MTTITQYIEPLLQNESLTFEQAKSLLDVVFEGGVPDVQIAAFLTAMRAKGPAAAELAGLAGSLRSHCVAVKVDVDNLIDTCGTGGAAIKTFNISTAAGIVAAGAGAYVAKHGNRGITSNCGSADVLEQLGVKIDTSSQTVADCIRHAHIGFMFAPMFHPAMKYVQPIRKGLGFRTVFNILGPLANPAGAQAQVVGVADENLMKIVAEALKLLGSRHAIVVHSNGLDEISIAGPSEIAELKDNEITYRQLNPKDLGIASAGIEKLHAGDAKTSAELITGILAGKETGPPKDIVILNAAAAIITAGLADDFEAAINLANESVRQGKALACLEKLIEISNASGDA